MSNELTYKEYKALVETQVRQMLDTLALAATGTLDIEIAIPEGIDVLTDMAYGFSFLLEDLRMLLKEQETAREELEMRIAERTIDLESTLAQAQKTQKRYISQEWEKYLQTHSLEGESAQLDTNLLPSIAQAIEQQSAVISEYQQDEETGFSLTLPVQYADEVVGVLGFQSEELQNLNEAELSAVEEIAEQVGLALENQRLFDQTQIALSQTETQAHRLTQLNELGASLTSTTSVHDIYAITALHIANMFGADRASIALWNEQSKTLDIDRLNLQGINTQEGTSQKFPTENTQIGITFTQNKLTRFDNISQSAYFDHRQFSKAGIYSTLCAPLTAQDTIGTINIASRLPNAFDQSDEVLIQQIASILATTIENRQLFDQTQLALSETEKQALRLARLNDMGTELNTALTTEDVYKVATSYTQELLEADIVSVTVLSENFQTFHVYATQGTKGVSQVGHEWGLDDTAIGEAVYRRQILYHPDITDTRFQDHKGLAKQGIQSTLIAPLIAQRVLGTLNAGSKQLNGFTEQEESMLLQIASLVAATIENRVLLEQTTRRAAQLEKLSQIENALSLAQSETEITEALGSAFPDYPHAIRLHYIQTDKQNRPISMQCVASWKDNKPEPNFALLARVNNLGRFNISRLWIDNPNKALYAENISQDERFNEDTRHRFHKQQINAVAFLPLRSAGSWQGLLNFIIPESYQFTSEQRFVFDNLLETLAAVVANHRALAAQQVSLNESVRRSRELDALNQVGRVVVQQLDPRELSNAIYDQIEQVIDFDAFFIGVYSGSTQSFDTLLFSDKEKRLYDLPTRHLTARNGTYQAIKQQQTILIQPTMSEFAEQPTPDVSQLVGDRTSLAPSRLYIPLMSGPTVIGAMSIHSNKFEAYTQNDVNLLNGIATYFAVAWQNATLFNETRRRADRERLVHEITQKIQTTTSVEKALQATVQELGRALKSRYTQIQLHIDDEDTVNGSGVLQHD